MSEPPALTGTSLSCFYRFNRLHLLRHRGRQRPCDLRAARHRGSVTRPRYASSVTHSVVWHVAQGTKGQRRFSSRDTITNNDSLKWWHFVVNNLPPRHIKMLHNYTFLTKTLHCRAKTIQGWTESAIYNSNSLMCINSKVIIFWVFGLHFGKLRWTFFFS